MLKDLHIAIFKLKIMIAAYLMNSRPYQYKYLLEIPRSINN